MTTLAHPSIPLEPSKIPPHNVVKQTAKPTYDPRVDREFFLRCLIFGAENTGKHTLISSSFPKEKTPTKSYIRYIDNLFPIPNPLSRNDVDFMNKTLEIPYNIKKYHFWTFTVTEKSLKNEAIWRGNSSF